MTTHEEITAQRVHLVGNLRTAATALLAHQSIAAGVVLDLDDGTCVAAGTKSAILHTLVVGAFAAQPVEAAGAAPNWLPTAENVNALPEGLRRYVHDLESRCDPAGDVAALTGLRDQLDGVQIMYRKAADALEEVRGCFHAAEVEGLSTALAETTDEHLKDLVERRLMYALYAAQETATHPAEPVGGDVRDALQFIYDTFKRDLDAGYKTRDKEFAVEIAAEALRAPVGGALVASDEPVVYLRWWAAQSDEGHGNIGHDEWFEVCEPGDHSVDGTPAFPVYAAPAGALVAMAEPSKPTDISARLREYAANNGYSHNDYADTMRQAAEEIERYYGGMIACKRSAESAAAPAERSVIREAVEAAFEERQGWRVKIAAAVRQFATMPIPTKGNGQ